MDDAAKVPRKIRAKAAEPPSISWTGADYPRIAPGRYYVVGASTQGPLWIRAFRRWGLRVEFATLTGEGNVSRFFNLGSDPLGPQVGRKSEYFSWWSAANGEPPKRGQMPSPDVFLDGQIFEVTVDDALTNGKGEAKRDDQIYSRVTQLHGVTREASKQPKACKPSKLLKQESSKAPNHASNQSKEGKLRGERNEASSSTFQNHFQASPLPGEGTSTIPMHDPKGGGLGPRSGKDSTIH